MPRLPSALGLSGAYQPKGGGGELGFLLASPSELRRPKVSFAALTTRARAGALASGQAVPAEGKARPGGEPGGRSGWQLHLS
eukprot:scaffold7341_cov129-Isochrysis_galbana.AAC.1